MNKTHDNLEELLSRVADEDLTVDERKALEAAVAADPSIAAQAQDYARLARLLAGWRTLPAGVDHAALGGAVRELIADEAAFEVSQNLDHGLDPAAGLTPRVAAAAEHHPNLHGQMASVDRLVAGAAGSVPRVDWNALQARIAGAVYADAAERAARTKPGAMSIAVKSRSGRSAEKASMRPARSSWLRWTPWIATPLAAAAAVAFAVLGWRPVPEPVNRPVPLQVAVAGVTVQFGAPQGSGTIVFSFNESDGAALEQPAWSEHAPRQGGMAIAVAPPRPAAAANPAAEPDYTEEALLF